MKPDAIQLAVTALEQWIDYPIEYRIAKYLIVNGYSGMNDPMTMIIEKTVPSLNRVYSNLICNCMRDIHNTTNPKDKFHINNIPNIIL